MIDIKELRVGNHILVDGERQEVYGISPKGFTIRYDAELIFGCAMLTKRADIQPIPLTAELLTELGFGLWVEEQGWRTYTKNGLDVRILVGNDRIVAKIKQRSFYTPIEVKYLHELENIVYPLLHKELIEE